MLNSSEALQTCLWAHFPAVFPDEVGEQKLPALAVLTQEQELAAHPVTRPDPSQDEALRVILHDLDKASSSDTPLEVVAPYLRFHGVVRASFQLADYRFGKAMAKCKEQLEPGRNWKDWLQAAVTVSYKTVLRAIRLYHFCQRFPGAIAIDRVKSFCVTKLQCDRLAAAIDALEVKGPWAQPPSWFRKVRFGLLLLVLLLTALTILLTVKRASYRTAWEGLGG
jgi:hypothetical protein